MKLALGASGSRGGGDTDTGTGLLEVANLQPFNLMGCVRMDCDLITYLNSVYSDESRSGHESGPEKAELPNPEF
jgi:hypothetical protein